MIKSVLPPTATPGAGAGASGPGPSSPSLYACAQCGKTYALTNRDTVRCAKCGYRIMFKLRDKSVVACVAR